jgi:hypothetical protein
VFADAHDDPHAQHDPERPFEPAAVQLGRVVSTPALPMSLPIASSVQQSGSTSCISPKTKKLEIECKAIAPLFLPTFHLNFPRTPVTQSEHLRLDPGRLWNAHMFYGSEASGPQSRRIVRGGNASLLAACLCEAETARFGSAL